MKDSKSDKDKDKDKEGPEGSGVKTAGPEGEITAGFPPLFFFEIICLALPLIQLRYFSVFGKISRQ